MMRAAQHCTLFGLVVLAACQSPDPWDEVDGACHWDAFFQEFPPTDEGVDGDGRIRFVDQPSFPSVACVETLAEQVGLDLVAFEDEAYEAMPAGRWNLVDDDISLEETQTNLFRIMTGLRSPFVLDMGRLDDMQPSRLLSEDFTERLQREGRRRHTQSASRAAFSYAARNIDTLRPATPEEIDDLPRAGMARLGNGLVVTLQKDTGGSGLWAFTLLIHEARHHAGPNHEVMDVGPLEDVSLDLHNDGTYGASLAIPILVHRNLDRDQGFEDWPRWDRANNELTRLSISQMNNILDNLNPQTGLLWPRLFDKYEDDWLDPWQ